MKENAIEVIDLTKIYKLYHKPTDRIKEVISIKKKKYHNDFYALNHISFEVEKGETLGIIGKNGAGKSTLLKLITGVATPTSGTLKVNGTISALLELGSGFNSELSGIDNIYLNGTLLGVSKNKMKEKIPEILDFADIGDFVYQPVKTYSSGMMVRLAFAVAINVKPEILIVDEALSVGDMRFQQKCFRKIREIKNNGTILFVSHDSGAIASFCDRVIWLDDGTIYKEGRVDKILQEYQAYMSYDIKEMQEIEFNQYEKNKNSDNKDLIKAKAFGTGQASFTYVKLINKRLGSESYIVKGGDLISINLNLEIYEDITMPILGFSMKDELGNAVIVTNTYFEEVQIDTMIKGKEYKIEWEFVFPMLRNGKYTVDVAFATGTYLAHEQVQWINDALIIICKDSKPYQEGRGYLVPNNIKFKLNS